jgi:hypothetical protein
MVLRGLKINEQCLYPLQGQAEGITPPNVAFNIPAFDKGSGKKRKINQDEYSTVIGRLTSDIL